MRGDPTIWTRVIIESRKYAMMKTMGKYIDEHGCIVTVCASDRDSYTKMFEDNMRMFAVDAIAEELAKGAGL
ncbi:MAG TPA: hypothetical protein VFM18_18855 [Methanosarcina sp.]|nr:hypothetical protein [Methanosarcina sp.]